MSANHEAALMLSVSGARGIVGQTMTPEVAAQLARAFVEDLIELGNRAGAIVIGRDGRPSGVELEQAAAGAIESMGFRPVRLGVATTPSTAIMVMHLRAAGGIVITASHNPSQWNGVKFLTARGAAPGAIEAQRIIDRFRRLSEHGSKPHTPPQAAGDDSAVSIHVDRVMSHIDSGQIARRRFRVVLDSVNASGCAAGRLLLGRLGAEVIHLNGEPTGDFAHTPEPMRENLMDLAEQVAAQGADVGFAQDPDADRLAVIDEAGRYIGEEYTFVLAAEQVLAQNGGGKCVAVNLSSSRMIDDVAGNHGARVLRTPVGEANVVEAMRRHGCAIGGEGNGGVIWPEICFVRDSLSGMALILSLLAQRGQPLSQIVDAMPSYAIEKSKCAIRPGLAQRAINALASRHSEARQDTQDGLRLDWPERGAWLHVRASNTEPILRLIAEARDTSSARQLIGEAHSVVASL